jgi:hypothetical protein
VVIGEGLCERDCGTSGVKGVKWLIGPGVIGVIGVTGVVGEDAEGVEGVEGATPVVEGTVEDEARGTGMAGVA